MPPPTVPSREDRRELLRADCSRCAGLCCVALAFARSADFALDKSAGDPCVHLGEDFGCGIHDRLRPRGFKGCDVFDCYGAGQRIVQTTFAGRDWRRHPELRAAMFAALPLVRGLHELLWYLGEALDLPEAGPVHRELAGAYARISALTDGDVAGIDLDEVRAGVAPLLARASALARTGRQARGLPARVRRGGDLVGAPLAGRDLRGADLRGALLIAADLSGADLRHADLIGADLRDADLRGADLGSALFLTQPQVTAARGDAATRLPAPLERPGHWER
ncbi:pentapeptide repeat-containing protein [Georgenia faecalis]|uniref:Pentapeptide repeat-containing protein n=1 Tax=Georgenia faecalis TaxID=2483799 RepID=A0ABV9D8G1_9MICO|nr:pentapeptide repeat-containing protein [Georgenia faecalis]